MKTSNCSISHHLTKLGKSIGKEKSVSVGGGYGIKMKYKSSIKNLKGLLKFKINKILCLTDQKNTYPYRE